MNYQNVLKLLLLVLCIGSSQMVTGQQGWQLLQKTTNRDLFHNCSSPTLDGGFYMVSHYFVRNLADTIPDSIGIHVLKSDFKGEEIWAKEYHLDAEDVAFERYQKSIECLTMTGDTLAIIASDLEAQETSSARIYLKINPDGNIEEQYRLEDISAEEEIITNLNCELITDHNRELLYLGTHNSDDTKAVHLEKLSDSNNPISRSYFATDTLGEEMDLSLGSAVALDTGFVFNATVGDMEDGVAAMVVLDSLGVPMVASQYMMEDMSETRLEFLSVVATRDTCHIHLGIMTNVMDQSEFSTLVKTDSIGRVLWAKRLRSSVLITQGQELHLTGNNQLIVVGKYKDFGTTVGDFALFLDVDGNVLREMLYESEVSAWTDDVTLSDFDAMDINAIAFSNSIQLPNLLITSQGQQDDGAWAPMAIKTDLDGSTLCNFMNTVPHTLEDYTLLRDTLLIGQGVFVDRALSEFFVNDFNDYDLATTTLQDITLCRNDVPKDTFLDATVMGVDSMLVSYVWSKDDEPTGDTTAIINFVIPNTDEEPQYTVVATVLDQVCFTLCDTASISFFPEPEAFIEARYLCDADPSEKWLITAGNSMGSVASVEWQTTTGQILSDDITVAVPETPGAVYQATITDQCGLTASTTWEAPPFPVATIDLNFDNLCPVPGYITIIAGMIPVYDTPLQFQWQKDGVNISNEASIEVREADLNGGAVTYSVTVTDPCGNVDEISVDIDPSNFELSESSLGIDRLGLVNATPCPYALDAIFVDGTTGSATPNSIIWSTGETTPSILVTEPGDYTVTVVDACDRELTATVTITAADLDSPPPSAEIMNNGFNPCDYIISGVAIEGVDANGQAFPIDSSGWTGPGGFTSGNEQLIVTEVGTYTYTIRDICGKTASASVDVLSLDIPDPTVEISNGGLNAQCLVMLQAEGTSAPDLDEGMYEWNNGTGVQSNNVDGPGVFTVTYTDQCGQTVTAEITLTETDFIAPAPEVSITSSEVTEECDRTLTAEVTNNVEVTGYEWSNGKSGLSRDTIEVTKSQVGQYSVTVTGCGTSSSATFIADNAEIKFPDIFFPNSTSYEGVNATFGPEVSCPDFTDYKLEIFNRWGKRVFEADRYEDRWTGSLNNQGNRLEEDVYMWQCTYTSAAGEQLMKGSVTSVPR